LSVKEHHGCLTFGEKKFSFVLIILFPKPHGLTIYQLGSMLSSEIYSWCSWVKFFIKKDQMNEFNEIFINNENGRKISKNHRLLKISRMWVYL
jgi:hypothetical protein